MISEIEAGNVEILIVKDMSRLGRNYLQVFYTEILFPQKKVHFYQQKKPLARLYAYG